MPLCAPHIPLLRSTAPPSPPPPHLANHSNPPHLPQSAKMPLSIFLAAVAMLLASAHAANRRACYPNGARAQGAAGRPFVEYLPCCDRTAAMLSKPGDWGLFCTKLSDRGCYQTGERAQGAVGMPYVNYKVRSRTCVPSWRRRLSERAFSNVRCFFGRGFGSRVATLRINLFTPLQGLVTGGLFAYRRGWRKARWRDDEGIAGGLTRSICECEGRRGRVGDGEMPVGRWEGNGFESGGDSGCQAMIGLDGRRFFVRLALCL